MNEWMNEREWKLRHLFLASFRKAHGKSLNDVFFVLTTKRWKGKEDMVNSDEDKNAFKFEELEDAGPTF